MDSLQQRTVQPAVCVNAKFLTNTSKSKLSSKFSLLPADVRCRLTVAAGHLGLCGKSVCWKEVTAAPSEFAALEAA